MLFLFLLEVEWWSFFKMLVLLFLLVSNGVLKHIARMFIVMTWVVHIGSKLILFDFVVLILLIRMYIQRTLRASGFQNVLKPY